MRNPRVSQYEEMTKTATFVLTLRQIMWLRDVSSRKGKNLSELVREVLDAAIVAEEKEQVA
jgi:hypothetical protein